MSKKPQKTVRLVVQLSEDEHRQLKSKIALLGMTVSDWVRAKVRKLIAQNEV